MTRTETFYAVEIHSPDRIPDRWLAIAGNHPGPFLSYWHREAVKYKNELVANGIKHACVVRISVDFTWETTSKPRALRSSA